MALLDDKDHIWIVAPGVLYSAINPKLPEPLRAFVSLAVIANSVYFQFSSPSLFRLFFGILVAYV